MIQRAGFDPFVMNGYPTRDGRQFDSDHHRDEMFAAIEALKRRFAPDPWVYVSGNLMVCYEGGNKRRHVAPDVFVVKGIPRGERPNLLLFREGGRLDVVIEVTSRTTRAEDTRRKFELYRDRLGVKEYFLFDPFEEYLNPTMQGHKRVGGVFRPIRPVNGRLPSKLLGLHLERDGDALHFWNPDTQKRLLTPTARAATAEQARRAAEAEAEIARERAAVAEAESDRLRRAVEDLRRKLAGGQNHG